MSNTACTAPDLLRGLLPLKKKRDCKHDSKNVPRLEGFGGSELGLWAGGQGGTLNIGGRMVMGFDNHPHQRTDCQ